MRRKFIRLNILLAHLTKHLMKLRNKVALVTGASRGIGRAIALKLAGEGASIVVHYKGNEGAAREVLEQVEQGGARGVIASADLSNMSDVRAMFARIETTFPRLDILVNNAGWADFKPLENVSEDDFDAIFDLNVKGLFFTTQEAVKRMNDGGRLVHISSGITRTNVAGGSVYAGSKAAIESFSKCWAAELGPRQITSNVVSPGMTETDLLMSVTPREVLDLMEKQTPLGRLGQPEDIADVVAFLCTDDARWLTAQNLLANGGVG
jgi:3-oxoacyl-[acyl-carrier protein] reductase